MGKTFRASVYTPQDISRTKSARVLWELLDDPLITPQRFDSVERTKIDFDQESYDRASEIYGTEGMLFVRGSKDNFTAMFMRQHGGWGIWNFWWDVKAMTQRKRDLWLEWLFQLCRELPVFYGFGCSVAEFDEKHTSVETVPGGSVTRTIGVSAANFYEFLPGLYWLTIFGAKLAGHFDTRLESLPHARSVRLGSAGIAVILDDAVVPQDMGERLRVQSELSDLLGTAYFFDRTQQNIEYKAVPELSRALREMKN